MQRVRPGAVQGLGSQGSSTQSLLNAIMPAGHAQVWLDQSAAASQTGVPGQTVSSSAQGSG